MTTSHNQKPTARENGWNQLSAPIGSCLTCNFWTTNEIHEKQTLKEADNIFIFFFFFQILLLNRSLSNSRQAKELKDN